jgi:Protein of unknown function (DUF2442)
MAMVSVSSVAAIASHKLHVEFSDGTRGVYDCAGLLSHDNSQISDLKDPSFFARVTVNAGAPTWPNGFRLQPWTIQDEMSAAGALEN